MYFLFIFLDQEHFYQNFPEFIHSYYCFLLAFKEWLCLLFSLFQLFAQNSTSSTSLLKFSILKHDRSLFPSFLLLTILLFYCFPCKCLLSS